MAIKLNSPLKIIITILFCYFKNFLWKFERLLSSKIIEKYWLYSPCCNINLWAYLIPNSFYLPLPYYYITSPQLVTTSFLSIYVVFFFHFSFLLHSLVCDYFRPYNCTHFTYYKVILNILQDSIQQYVNQKFSGVQAGLRKSRGTRDQVANIC